MAQTPTCQNCKATFKVGDDDLVFYEKLKVPPPTFCPECRMQRRFAWRNERLLFRRKDSRTNEDIFSGIPPAAPATVYALDFWNSDGWDPGEYARDYDFSRPFFEQFREFLYTVPWPAKSVLAAVNSEYCDQTGYIKNSYLCFDGANIENSAYLVGSWDIKDSFDLFESRDSQLCYDDYMVDESYRTFFSINCESSSDVWFSNYLVGCQNCFGCVNLRQKSYCIFNKQVTKEEYQEFMAKHNLGSAKTVAELKKQAHEFWLKYPMRFTMGFRNTNSTGEHIENCKNVHEGYCIHGGENLKWCQLVEKPCTDSYDYTNWGTNATRMYEAVTCGEQVSDVKFSWECWPACRNVEYSAFCRSSSYCFASIGLKKKQYCIFNKQYTREQYEELLPKIIAHMNEMPYTDSKGHVYKYGEFFPVEFSPFAYNETLAADFIPLKKEEVLAAGFAWRDPDQRVYETTIEAANLPDDIKDVQDSVLKEIIKCVGCGKAYRIIPMELDFLRRINLPLPHYCPECRYQARFKFVNLPKLYPGKCQCTGTGSENGAYTNQATHFHGTDHCPTEYMTSFEPGRPDIVYCEQCYQTEAV